jgi:hypothetical protein
VAVDQEREQGRIGPGRDGRRYLVDQESALSLRESRAIHLGVASIDMDQSIPVVPARNRCPDPCFEMDIVKTHVVAYDRGRIRN